MPAILAAQGMFVVATVNNRLFAVPVGFVQGMVPVGRITVIPESPAFVRGVTILRGATVPVVDLRVRMGMISCVAEGQSYIEQLSLREQEHRHWLKELEDSVKEKRPFTLPADPHQCAFGRWYDSYEYGDTTHRCMALDHVLVKFKNPHERIHTVANEVLTLGDAGRYEAALDLIEKTRTTILSQLINLFEEARMTLREGSRELLILISNGERQAALTADTVESVETLSKDSAVAASELNMGLHDPLFSALARRRQSDQMVLVLDVSEFLPAAAK